MFNEKKAIKLIRSSVSNGCDDEAEASSSQLLPGFYRLDYHQIRCIVLLNQPPADSLKIKQIRCLFYFFKYLPKNLLLKFIY